MWLKLNTNNKIQKVKKFKFSKFHIPEERVSLNLSHIIKIYPSNDIDRNTRLQDEYTITGTSIFA